MLIILIRTLIVYVVVTVAVRLMGKRQVSDMQTSELVITLIISEVASLPLENPERPLLSGIVTIFIIAAIEIIVSVVMLKSRKARGLICGHPVIVIRNAKILTEELKRLRISREDVYSLLRQKDLPDESGVKFGIIEPNGSLSVLKYDDFPQDGISSEALKAAAKEANTMIEKETKSRKETDS